jgi:hypothetical protein
MPSSGSSRTASLQGPAQLTDRPQLPVLAAAADHYVQPARLLAPSLIVLPSSSKRIAFLFKAQSAGPWRCGEPLLRRGVRRMLPLNDAPGGPRPSRLQPLLRGPPPAEKTLALPCLAQVDMPSWDPPATSRPVLGKASGRLRAASEPERYRQSRTALRAKAASLPNRG